ncbi:MAG: hypothetical protein EXS18_06535 [Verrucomicrobiae bacterium]|nr:hypothetical protein [Verrucomicrobiae bacterium]
MTLTNEGADQIVDGLAIDIAGNKNFTAVMVSIDKTVPTVTGQPANGDVICTLRPPLVVAFSDELSGIDATSLHVLLDGTNITANFQTFAAGAYFVPTNNLAVGSHTWHISIADVAGSAVASSATFTVDTNAACPTITDLNIADGTELPDVEAVWVQGKRGDTNTSASFTVNFGSP